MEAMIETLRNIIARTNYSSLALVGVFSLACFVELVEAADEDAMTENVNRAVQEELALGDHKLMEAFDGWQPEYGGFRRSPILFDPLETDKRKRVFPENGILGLGKLDLHVDDEIDKSQLITFQSIPTIAKGFADNQKARDDHLNLFATVRGVAISTLSYLDKTVAAALATTQQQVDQDVIQQMLKQISWTNAQIANPDREELFQDINEKFEACMWMAGRLEDMNTDALPDYLKHVSFTFCNTEGNECAEAYSHNKSKAYDDYKGRDYPWAYHYCVCCAERDVGVNRSTVNSQVKSPVEKKGWSLVERLFFGNRRANLIKGFSNNCDKDASPLSSGCGERIETIEHLAKYWRALYGDYLAIDPSTQVDTGRLFTEVYGEGSEPDPNVVGRIKIVYVPPYLSVPQWIELFRNFSELGETDKELNAIVNACGKGDSMLEKLYPYYTSIDKFYYCPITQESLKWGICPALKEILAKFDDGTIGDCYKNETTTEKCDPVKVEQQWIEASLGGILTAKDFVVLSGMRASTGGSSSSSSSGKENVGDRRDRWIATYCDSAAATAFKKLHLRMMSITLDFMTYNTKLTRNQKDRVMKLMNRVSSYLELGAMDSITAVRNQLVALHVEGDRRGEAERAAMWSSAIAAQETSQQLGELLTFGGSLDLPSK